ncbi:MAG: hypothetical protein V1822_04145 [Candidatus Micrarchaeota archaeon]
MRTRQEISSEVSGLAQMLEQLEQRLGRIEQRMSSIESALGGAGAGDSQIWAKKGVSLGADASFSGVQVSGSNAPLSVMSGAREIFLSSTDEQIVGLVRNRGAVCAEDVQLHFRYKGKNAASARLNRLAGLGVLERQQAGRRVYYKMRN